MWKEHGDALKRKALILWVKVFPNVWFSRELVDELTAIVEHRVRQQEEGVVVEIARLLWVRNSCCSFTLSLSLTIPLYRIGSRL